MAGWNTQTCVGTPTLQSWVSRDSCGPAAGPIRVSRDPSSQEAVLEQTLLIENLPQGYQPLECWDYPHQIGQFGAVSGLPQLQKEPSEQRDGLFLDRPNKGILASGRDLIGGPCLLYVPAPPDSASTLAPARVFRAHDLHDLDVAAMSSRSASHRERSSAGTLLASQHSCPH